MPKTTLIKHPESQYYLTLRRHIIEMFSGDHCAAALFSFFEFATNGELARMERSNQAGDPWITATMPSIFNDTVGLYSVRRLQERIAWMAKLGFVTEVCVPGKINRYLFDIARANKAIVTTEVFQFDPGQMSALKNFEKQPDPGQTIGQTIGQMSDGGGVLDSKEEELRTEELNTPIPPFFSETENQKPSSSELGEQEFKPTPPAPSPTCTAKVELLATPVDPKETTRLIASKLKQGGAKPRAEDKRKIGEELLRLDPDVTEEQVLSIADEFLVETYWHNYYHPASAFPKFLQDSLDEAPRIHTTKAAASQAQSPGLLPSTDTPNSPTGLGMPVLPIWVERWNQAGLPKTITWNGHSPKAKLAEAEKDPEFVQHYQEILERCATMIRVGHPYININDFSWLFKKSKDADNQNWYRVYKGDFAWAEKPKTANSKPKTAVESLKEKYAAMAKETVK
jgi:hypothetical protein